MKKPKTNNEEILFTAIKNGSVSLLDFPYLSGFRSRISNLKLKFGVEFEVKKVELLNKFGRVIRYHVHVLKDVEKAKSIYNKMTRL